MTGIRHRRITLHRLLTPALALLLAGCASSGAFVERGYRDQPEPPAEAPAFRVFLIGETALPEGREASPALDLLAERLRDAGENSAVVFLGDQLRRPLPDSGSADRAAREAQLRRVVDAVEGFAGEVFVVPGRNDWGEGPDGAEALEREADFFEQALGEDVVLPEDGLPGPAVVKLAAGFRLVALDTEWWFRDPTQRPTGDDAESEIDVVVAMQDVIDEYDDDRLLVVSHYPLLANGPHGGRFTLREHLFPLTELVPGAYLPLPVVGSVYPLYRAYVGGPRDLAAGRYRALREALLTVMEGADAVVYAAAHERGLQYTLYATGKNGRKRQHHVLSGSAGGAQPLAPGYGAAFAHGTEGFAVLDYYDDGRLWLTFLDAEAAARGEDPLAFRTRLEGPLRERIDPEVPGEPTLAERPVYADSIRIAVADPNRAKGPIYRAFFGTNYRAAWTAPVEAPVLDLGVEAGGLTPVKRGGGFQTVSLRVENEEGKEYVLRQVKKDVRLTLPEQLHDTFAADVFGDQITTSNPYAAYVVPGLADAAGIYHTSPRLALVPDDPLLGRYRELFADRLVLFEERPDDEHMAEDPNYGFAPDIVSKDKVRAETRDDNDHRVDQPFFLRNRLFDFLIGDWDRHPDQWRWAAFEPYQLDPTLTGEARTEGKVYRAIPRDRDQAFFTVGGLVPRLVQRIDPRLQDFDEGFGDIVGFTANSIHQDRRFLSALSREDWIAVAEELQAAMTDEAIREALGVWHEMGVYEASQGDRVFRTLQARRDGLVEAAEEYYEVLARAVDVLGSDKHERFVVERLPGGDLDVTVYKTTKEGEDRRIIYQRRFFEDETEEVRLFGFGGRDRFELVGDEPTGIFVRVIGGAGEDAFADATTRRGVGGDVRYYDTAEGNAVERAPGTRLWLSNDPAVNLYDEWNYLPPFRQFYPFFGYNDVDGLFLGAGVAFTKPGFRKGPYARRQSLAANVSTLTTAVNARYDGHWVDAVARGWDTRVSLGLESPQSVRNFFGIGNDTADSLDVGRFYRLQRGRVGATVGVEREFVRGGVVRLAPRFEVIRFDDDEGALAALPGLLGSEGVVEYGGEDEWRTGADLLLDLGRVDRPANPRQGFRWMNAAGLSVGVRNLDAVYGRLATDLALYISPRLEPQTTLALRVGAAHVVGEYPFYDAVTLGGRENLRGYRSTRFAGRTAAFGNAELRQKLASFRTYTAAGALGLLAFADAGRVWADGEGSSTLHAGYGGGLWLDLFDLALFTATVGASAEGVEAFAGFGFQF